MIEIIVGDCREVLETLPPESVHSVITSPPYWNLRDYGTGTWDGGDPECDHSGELFTNICGRCGAEREDRQLGLERDPESYLESMVGVFRSVWRVLRADGTLWLNMGDTYSGSQRGPASSPMQVSNKGSLTEAVRSRPRSWSGVKPKDLMGMPWRLALALQADGWYLRSDIIWHKLNPMPESVRDRPTKAHEYLFLLSKSPQYFYDLEAIREPVTGGAHPNGHGIGIKSMPAGGRVKNNISFKGAIRNEGREDMPTRRNKRSVWSIANAPYAGAHFATFPPALIEPCVKAGTSERGVCPECGAGWERQTEESAEYAAFKEEERQRKGGGMRSSELETFGLTTGSGNKSITPSRVTLGWAPACQCAAGDPVRAVVLDLFAGAGTTGIVADRLGRDAILIELRREYAEMSRERLIADAGMFAKVAIR